MMEFKKHSQGHYGVRTQGHQWIVVHDGVGWQASYKTLDNFTKLAQVFYSETETADMMTMMLKLGKFPHYFANEQAAMEACRRKYESLIAT